MKIVHHTYRNWYASILMASLLAVGCAEPPPGPEKSLFEPAARLPAMIEVMRDGPNYELVGSGFVPNEVIELRCANPQPFTTFTVRTNAYGNLSLKGVAHERGRFRFYAYKKTGKHRELKAFAAFDYECGEEEGEKPDTARLALR